MLCNLEGRLALTWLFLVDLYGKRRQEMNDKLNAK